MVIQAPGIEDIRAAAERLRGLALHSPLVRFNPPDGGSDIYLKLENLQPVGAFKVRSMGNILLSAKPENLEHGVYTASSGNAGYGLAWMARHMHVPATVYVPDSAPEGKVSLIRRLGAKIKVVPYPQWWEIICNHGLATEKGMFVDAVCDPAALTGNATIGLELIEDLPDISTIVVPFGGGGLSCGIAAAVKTLKPDTRIIAAECETALPITAALNAGRPVDVEHRPSFVSGIGATAVLTEMWPLIQQLLDGSVVSSLTAVADAVRMLFEYNRVVAEGAGATALAGALSLDADGPVVCVISGGNIDNAHMASILQGRQP